MLFCTTSKRAWNFSVSFCETINLLPAVCYNVIFQGIGEKPCFFSIFATKYEHDAPWKR